MNETNSTSRQSALDPASRISEILFGLIMVLTFTSSMRATEIIREDVREMLIGALGCNLAWGIIDAFMYLITVVTERGREQLMISKLKACSSPSDARLLLGELLPESVAGALSEPELDQLRASVVKIENPTSKRLITVTDIRGAFVVFALVFLTIFPVAIPFMIIKDEWQALRVSNLIALILLFGLGYSLGQYAGRKPWEWGLKMTVIGVLLVATAIYFGG